MKWPILHTALPTPSPQPSDTTVKVALTLKEKYFRLFYRVQLCQNWLKLNLFFFFGPIDTVKANVFYRLRVLPRGATKRWNFRSSLKRLNIYSSPIRSIFCEVLGRTTNKKCQSRIFFSTIN